MVVMEGEITMKTKWVKHVIKEGSREHVLSYDTKGVHCSCKNCEINKHHEVKS